MASRYFANMARIRQSRPDSGLGFQASVHQSCGFVPFLLGSGSSCSWKRVIFKVEEPIEEGLQSKPFWR